MPLSRAPYLPLPPSPSRNTAKLAESVCIKVSAAPVLLVLDVLHRETLNGSGLLTSDKQRLPALVLELRYLYNSFQINKKYLA